MGARTAAVLVAAGRGERLGGGIPKAFREVGGVPLIVHAVQRLAASTYVDDVTAVVPADLVTQAQDTLAGLSQPSRQPLSLRVVAGGRSRTESVHNGLQSLDPSAEVVLVHDAARAFTPAWLVDAVASAVLAGADAVVPGLRVTDTIKVVTTTGDARPSASRAVSGMSVGTVTDTPPRELLRSVQTPQAFRHSVLAAAYEHSDAGAVGGWGGDGTPVATDDASLVERLGVTVTVVPGHEAAAKITTPRDLVVAEALLAAGYFARSDEGPVTGGSA